MADTGFWGRAVQTATERKSRMQEVAEEMARRQADAERRRREEEERRRQEEQQRRAEEEQRRAEQAKREQEAAQRSQLRAAEERNRAAQNNRAALVLSNLNRQDHENYQTAKANDPMLTQANYERNFAAMTGDTNEANRVSNWIRDREALIKQNTVPAARTTKTLAEYQDEWNATTGGRPQKTAREQAIEDAIEDRRRRSQEGLSKYAAAQQEQKKAQVDADQADRWKADEAADTERVYAEARQLALQMGYRENELPQTVEEMAALDPRIAENEQIRQYLGNKQWLENEAARAKETLNTANQAVDTARNSGDISGSDWENLQRYEKNQWAGTVFNPLTMNKGELELQKEQIKTSLKTNLFNIPQRSLGWKTISEIDRRLQIMDDPKKTTEDLDNEIAFLEGLNGSYWDDQDSEIQGRLKNLKRQKVLIAGAGLSGEADYGDDSVQAGYDAWHDAAGRTMGDTMTIGLGKGSNEEQAVRMDVSFDIGNDRAAQQVSQLSAEGQKLLYLNEEEKKRYFYLYGKSPERAAEYLDALDDEIAERRNEARQEEFETQAENLPGLTDVSTSLMELAKPLTATQTLVENVIMGKDYQADNDANRPDQYQQAVRNVRKDQLTKFAEEHGMNPVLLTGAYDIAMQTGDNLVRAYGTAAMGVTNPGVTTGLMAYGAAGSTTRDLMAEGVDADRAALVGGIAGIAEYVTEKWSDIEWFKGMKEGFTGWKDLGKAMLQSAVMEGSTEVASDIISLVGEALVLGDENSYEKKVKDYYYYTGDMAEARKLAFQDQLGQEMYTFTISALSGAGMEGANRAASGIWQRYTDNKKAEVNGGNKEIRNADQAQDSYATEEGAQAAAETAGPQYTEAELDDALAAAAAPMNAEDAAMEQQAAAQAVPQPVPGTVPAGAQIRDRVADEIAAGMLAQQEEAMPAERRQTAPNVDAIAQPNPVEGTVPAAVREDSVTGVEPMPVERREAIPEAEPGTVDAIVQAVPNVTVQTAGKLNNQKVRQLAQEWISEGDSAEDVMKNTTLADVKATVHDDSAEGIHDDAQWREAAGSVYDDLMDRYGEDLAKDTDGIWGRLAGYVSGQVQNAQDVFAKVNNPLFSTMQKSEIYAMAGQIADEYKRRQETMTAKAREMAKKYGFISGDDAGKDGGNGVVLRTVGDDLNAEQVTQLRVLDRFARNLKDAGLPGLDINVYRDIRSTDGGKLNGSYNTYGTVKDAATVNLSLDAEGGNVLRAAGHELYHMIETWGKDAAGKIRSYVLDALEGTEGYDLDARREELKEAYGEDADIDSEIVADSMFDVLNNEDTITQVMQENRSLGQRIRDFVTKIHAALKAAVDRIAGMGSREAQALKDQASVLDTIRQMWEQGVEIAQKNIEAARAAENIEGYAIKAVAEINDPTARSAGIDFVADQLLTNTQGDLVTDDVQANIGLRTKLLRALKAYGLGEKSLAAALEDQGLRPITNTNDRKAAAWLSREAAEPVEIKVSDKLSRQTLEEQFHEIWDDEEDDGTGLGFLAYEPSTTAERALNLLYKIHDERDRKGMWKDGLDSFVDEISEDSYVDRDKVKSMLKLLYTSIDQDNKVYSKNAAEYAGLIVDEIVKGHEASQAAVSEDETAVYKSLRGTVIQLSDVLVPSTKQTRKDGTSLKQTRYDYGDLNAYGRTVKQLNDFGRRVGIKFQLRTNEKNRGVSPSTLLAENPTLAAWVGYGDTDDNGNEANLMGRILDWVDSYERRERTPYDPQRLRALASGKVEKIILNYFDMPGQLDDTQRAVNAIKKQAAAEQEELENEIYGLRYVLNYKEELLQEARDETKATEAALKRQERANEVAQKRIERMKQRAEVVKQRATAENYLRTMRQWLLHPTKQEGKHVSEGLRSTLATALSLVNTGSVNNPDSIRTYDFNMLLAAINKEQQETGSTLVVDANLEPTLQYLAEKASGKMLMEMDGKELAELNDALRMIINMCRDANKLRSQKQKAGIMEIGESFIAGLQTQKDAKLSNTKMQSVKDFVNYTMMDPERFFEMVTRLGGESGRTMWQILRQRGLDKQITLTAELEDMMHKAFDQYAYKDWAGGKNQRTSTFDLDSGERITLTDGQIMCLYLLNQREQGRQHIYGGGITAKRTDLRGGPLVQNAPRTVTESDVNRIISALSDEQIEAANKLQKIVGEWGSQIGNEASMDLYGYKKFKEAHYFPIKSLGDTLGVKGTEYERNNKGASLYAVTNLGMTKELDEHATNALVLGNVFDVALDHLADMITYRSWAAPLTDMTRILNYKNENTSVVREMNRVFGEAGTNYIIQLLKDINGMTKDHVEGQAAQFTSQFRNFKAAAVGFNISTVLKQGLSIVRAFDVIPSYYFPTARQLTERFKREGEKGDRAWTVDKLMEKYAPIYKWKQAGRFTMDTGKDMKSIMLPKTEKVANKITEFGMAAAGMADNVTWRTIWYAAERMTERTHKELQKGSDAYYREVGRLFTECVDKTQVVDSILHRTQVMRSNSMWVKLGTSFMGEPLKTFNQATDAIRTFVENKTAANGAKLAKTGIVLMASAILQAAIASIISGFRRWNDDEPLEETIRKYMFGDYDPENGFMNNAVEFLFGNNLAGELNPINYIPFARDIADIAQGHDVTRDDMQMLTNLWEKLNNLTSDKGKASTAKKALELGGAIGDFFGIPTSNILKEIDYVSNWGSRILESMGMRTEAVQYYRLMYNKAMGKSTNMADYAAFMVKMEEAVKEGKVEPEFVEKLKQSLIGAGYEEEKLEKKAAKIQLTGLAGDVDEDLDGTKLYVQALIDAIDSGDTKKEAEIRAALKRNGTKDDAINENIRSLRMAEYTTGTKVEDFYDEYVRRMKAGDKAAAAKIGKILSDSYKGKSDTHDENVKKALAKDADFIKAVNAKLAGDLKAYQSAVDRYDGMGFDHDMLIKATNLVTNRINTEAKKASGETTEETEDKTYGESYGYNYNDLRSAYRDGSYESFWIVVEDLRIQGKKDTAIRDALTSEVKPIYLELKERDPAAAEKYKQQLISLGIGYTEKQIRQWKPTKTSNN